MSGLCFHDVRGEVEHILGHLLIGNVIKIIGFVPYLIRIPQGDAEQALAACFKRDDVLARREHDLADCDHALFADGFPDDSECLLTDLSVRGNVIGVVQVDFVDLVLGHELVDVDRALALNRDGFELLGIKLDIVALADLVPFDDVCGIDLITSFGIDLPALDALASVLVELMEAGLLALRGGRKEGDGARNEGQLEIMTSGFEPSLRQPIIEDLMIEISRFEAEYAGAPGSSEMRH